MYEVFQYMIAAMTRFRVQGRDALLLRVMRPVADAALGMGEHSACQRVTCLAVAQTCLPLHVEVTTLPHRLADGE